jgi:heme/copper-type cytochrome/quinol oxidase subunit 3
MTEKEPANQPVDPMPAATLGMWMFLASEAMFFTGLLSAYIVLQSVPGERALFVRSARVVSLPLTIVAGMTLVAASAIWCRRVMTPRSLSLAGGLAAAFLAIQAITASHLLSHETVVTASTVYDGRVIHHGDFRIDGVQMPLPNAFDVNRYVRPMFANEDRQGIDPKQIRVAANYGPSRNNYFACYFLVTVAHAVHVIGGLAALAWLMGRTRKGTATAAQTRVVTLYWQFVNGVGLLSLVLLSLG